jgi:hypothetical protein
MIEFMFFLLLISFLIGLAMAQRRRAQIICLTMAVGWSIAALGPCEDTPAPHMRA